jgi:hypothetical protein
MAILAKKKTFEPAPVGTYQALCIDAIDLGIQEFGGKPRSSPSVKFVFQVDQRMTNGARFGINAFFTLTLHERGNLRPFLEDWRGRPFTDAELPDGCFDVEKLVGVRATLTIYHEKNGDQVRAKIRQIRPADKDNSLVVEDYIRVQDRLSQQTTADKAPESGNLFDDNNVPF